MSVLINSYEKPLLRIVFHNRNLFTDMALKRYPRHNRPLRPPHNLIRNAHALTALLAIKINLLHSDTSLHTKLILRNFELEKEKGCHLYKLLRNVD